MNQKERNINFDKYTSNKFKAQESLVAPERNWLPKVDLDTTKEQFYTLPSAFNPHPELIGPRGIHVSRDAYFAIPFITYIDAGVEYQTQTDHETSGLKRDDLIISRPVAQSDLQPLKDQTDIYWQKICDALVCKLIPSIVDPKVTDVIGLTCEKNADLNRYLKRMSQLQNDGNWQLITPANEVFLQGFSHIFIENFEKTKRHYMNKWLAEVYPDINLNPDSASRVVDAMKVRGPVSPYVNRDQLPTTRFAVHLFGFLCDCLTVNSVTAAQSHFSAEAYQKIRNYVLPDQPNRHLIELEDIERNLRKYYHYADSGIVTRLNTHLRRNDIYIPIPDRWVNPF